MQHWSVPKLIQKESDHIVEYIINRHKELIITIIVGKNSQINLFSNNRCNFNYFKKCC